MNWNGAPSAEETAARLLMQAAFGPDRTSVASLAADLSTDAAAAVEGWVHAQMALPATLLRSYFRSKANPRLHSPLATGGVRRACDASSRWHRYAFSKEDVGKALSVASRLQYGCTWINTHFMLVSEMPHGGLKRSGYGKDLSMYALEDYTVVRHVMAKL